MPVFSAVAIDYGAGMDICDPASGRHYSDCEARVLPAEVRSRLVLRPRKVGCMVLTAEEACAALLNRLAIGFLV